MILVASWRFYNMLQSSSKPVYHAQDGDRSAIVINTCIQILTFC